MSSPSFAEGELQPYLTLAAAVAADPLIEDTLPQTAGSLPPLNRERLERLGALSLDACLNQPRYGWAIAALADAAAANTPAEAQEDRFLTALAAWYLARASNEWTRPERVAAAGERARKGFADLGETGWVAGALWQLNALPWTRNDFGRATVELSEALAALETAGFEHLVPHCRLSLAYAQILTARYDEALANIELSEQCFEANRDALYLTRTRWIRAACLRRQGLMDEAVTSLQACIADFGVLRAPIDVAKAKLTLALCRLNRGVAYQQAEQEFIAAATLLHEADLPLWAAQCYNALGLLYRNIGRMAASRRALSQAREIFSQYPVLGLRADSLLDSGKFAMYQGNPVNALDFLAQAQALYQQIGAAHMVGVALMYQGEAYLDLGRYERALTDLESARRIFQRTDELLRLAECEKILAVVWLRLNRPEDALPYIKRTVESWQRTQAEFFLGNAYYLYVEVLMRLGQGGEKLVPFLWEALAEWQERGRPYMVAYTQRLLGEVLIASKRSEDALGHLEAAVAGYAALHLPMEGAEALITLGRCLFQLSRLVEAGAAWERALDLSDGLQPEVDWQAWAGLAEVAEIAGDETGAFERYKEMIVSLGQLRRWFWQPMVAGTYLQRPIVALDRAVQLAARLEAKEETLLSIEDSKAQTLGRRNSARRIPKTDVETLLSEKMDIRAEIRWLQQTLRADAGARPGRLRPTAEGELRQRLREKVTQYDRLAGQLERAEWSGMLEASAANFKPELLHQLASAALGSDWVALSYYLSGDLAIEGIGTQLICVMVGPDDCAIEVRPLLGRERVALQALSRTADAGHHFRQRDLATLGSWLLPEALQARLRPATTLIIAPHRALHHLPWPTLCLRQENEPLVARCVPVIVPSLQTLLLLWQRAEQAASASNGDARRNGLLVAVSDFQGRWEPLPQVGREAEALAGKLGPAARQLSEMEGTWQNLLRKGQENGLSKLPFLHIASHAFHDCLTGRLSGVAFYDRDVWLDEFAECAPLPPLVTLSACSGLRSRIYGGDEHVSLPTTLLAYGSQQVIGSLWPIRDEHATGLMLSFYENFFDDKPASQALALAQRAALDLGLPAHHWGGLQCVGLPN